jgi:acid phosphatase
LIRSALIVLFGGALVAACSSTAAPTARPSLASWPVPTGSASASVSAAPDHVVVVVFENKALGQLDGSAKAPYINGLLKHSAVYTDLHAETHPSQPNYVALFSGDTHGVTGDGCPVRFHGTPNLGSQLIDAGKTFVGYSEALPHAGYTGCSSGNYAAKHNPWVDFDNVPASANQPASALPSDFSRLPTVSFLVPDLCDDMHDCPVNSGDAWSQTHLDPYARWAQTHNSVLIVTFDEDNRSDNNRILTFVCGPHSTPGRYNAALTHYSVLSTIESWYGLPLLGHAATATPLPHAWDR